MSGSPKTPEQAGWPMPLAVHPLQQPPASQTQAHSLVDSTSRSLPCPPSSAGLAAIAGFRFLAAAAGGAAAALRLTARWRLAGYRWGRE